MQPTLMTNLFGFPTLPNPLTPQIPSMVAVIRIEMDKKKYQLAGPEPLLTIRTIELKVIDDNDEVPLFGAPSYGLKIAENSREKTPVDNTTATDGDATPLYKKIKYKLKPTMADKDEYDLYQLGQGTFSIDEDTGAFV